MSYSEGPRDARITPDDRGAHMVICAFHTGTIALMAVLARFWIKWYQKKRFGWDDYVILCALVQTNCFDQVTLFTHHSQALGWGQSVGVCLLADAGIGKQQHLVSKEGLKLIQQVRQPSDIFDALFADT